MAQRSLDALRQITIDPTSATWSTTMTDRPSTRRPDRNTGVPPTAVFPNPATTIERTSTIERPANTDDPAVAIAAAMSLPTDGPVLTEGWVGQHRFRRRLAAWGAALAVAVCLLVLIAINGGADRDPSTIASGASDPTVTTTVPPAAAAVTIDSAAYLGHTEAEARAALTAVGMNMVTRTAPSTVDLAGLVIDVQPLGPVAPGSDVTITLGDGTIAAVADPPADESGNGNGKEKNKGKGKNRD